MPWLLVDGEKYAEREVWRACRHRASARGDGKRTGRGRGRGRETASCDRPPSSRQPAAVCCPRRDGPLSAAGLLAHVASAWWARNNQPSLRPPCRRRLTRLGPTTSSTVAASPRLAFVQPGGLPPVSAIVPLPLPPAAACLRPSRSPVAPAIVPPAIPIPPGVPVPPWPPADAAASTPRLFAVQISRAFSASTGSRAVSIPSATGTGAGASAIARAALHNCRRRQRAENRRRNEP
jgi:hypothetical protein